MRTICKQTLIYLATIIFSFIFVSDILIADPIDKSDVAFVARNFYEELNPVKNSDFSNSDFIDTPQPSGSSSCGGIDSAQSAGIETYHLVEFQGGGFFIVSADNDAPPILGYSFDSEQINDEIPPQLEEILQEYHDQIIQIREDNLDNPEAQAQWEELLTNDFDSSNFEIDGDVGE